MTIKTNARSMLIIAAGFWVGFSGSPQGVHVAEAASAQAVKIDDTATAAKSVVVKKSAKYSNRAWKKRAARKSGKIAWKSSHPKIAMADVPKLDDIDDASALPPDVANANARLASADPLAASAKVMSARANALMQTASQPDAVDGQTSDARLVSADQLNDVDRALTENNPPAPFLTMAAANAPAVISAPMMMASADDTAWSKSSIVGKIFIAFGGLLTLASAARMFMA